MSVDIVHFRAANIKTITPMLEGLEALWSTWTHSEKKFRLREIIRVKYKLWFNTLYLLSFSVRLEKKL